jgi:hypothetical protein
VLRDLPQRFWGVRYNSLVLDIECELRCPVMAPKSRISRPTLADMSQHFHLISRQRPGPMTLKMPLERS